MLEDTQRSEPKQLLELRAKKQPTKPAAIVSNTADAPSTPMPRVRDAEMTGTEAAAGVLTAVDEDIEGGEEAECPDEFELEDAPEAEGDVE